MGQKIFGEHWGGGGGGGDSVTFEFINLLTPNLAQ